MHDKVLIGLLLLLGSGGTWAADAADSLDIIARDYVAMTLEIGEHEAGYVDAYYGPPEWAAAAKANPRSTAELAAAAAALLLRLEQNPDAGLDADTLQRRAYLQAHVSAAGARLRMIEGERPAFADEAEALFGIRPELKPLSAFAALLQRIEILVPGEGPLAARVAAFRERYTIPTDRLDAVMRAAIAECRARTLRAIDLPEAERFTLEFVTDKPWGGYNYYQGNANSLIQINTDLPIPISRAVNLGCHEGYPGHHVYNLLLERTFVRGKGWVEMSVLPLFSPMALVAEGSANYGIDLAFPGTERLAFEKAVLYPLAGLDPATADALDELGTLTKQLAGVEYTIADDYLAGRSNRAEASALLQTWTLVSEESAEKRVDFIDTYRSYIINYALGQELVAGWIERQGTDAWAATNRLLSSQLLPKDLLQ